MNFTGESFMDVIGFSSYSYVHDGPGGSGRLRYEVEDGVAVNYQWEPTVKASFGTGVSGCPLCGPSTFELDGSAFVATQAMTLTLFTAAGGALIS